MNEELLTILEHIEREKGIDKEILFKAIESALASAGRKIMGNKEADVSHRAHAVPSPGTPAASRAAVPPSSPSPGSTPDKSGGRTHIKMVIATQAVPIRSPHRGQAVSRTALPSPA